MALGEPWLQASMPANKNCAAGTWPWGNLGCRHRCLLVKTVLQAPYPVWAFKDLKRGRGGVGGSLASIRLALKSRPRCKRCVTTVVYTTSAAVVAAAGCGCTGAPKWLLSRPGLAARKHCTCKRCRLRASSSPLGRSKWPLDNASRLSDPAKDLAISIVIFTLRARRKKPNTKPASKKKKPCDIKGTTPLRAP